jgi:hypothetical protein
MMKYLSYFFFLLSLACTSTPESEEPLVPEEEAVEYDDETVEGDENEGEEVEEEGNDVALEGENNEEENEGEDVVEADEDLYSEEAVVSDEDGNNEIEGELPEEGNEVGDIEEEEEVQSGQDNQDLGFENNIAAEAPPASNLPSVVRYVKSDDVKAYTSQDENSASEHGFLQGDIVMVEWPEKSDWANISIAGEPHFLKKSDLSEKALGRKRRSTPGWSDSTAKKSQPEGTAKSL